MPWRVAEGVEGCDGFAVVKKDTGKLVACHASKAKAEAQVRALYANEAQTAAAVGSLARELLEEAGGLTAAERHIQGPSVKRRFDESKHRRYPKGTPVSGPAGGGRFAPGDVISGRTLIGNHTVEGEVVGENKFGPIVNTTTGETLTVKDATAEHVGSNAIMESRDPTLPGIHLDQAGKLVGPSYFGQSAAEMAATALTSNGHPAVAEAVPGMIDSEAGQIYAVKLEDGTYFGADSGDRLHEIVYYDEFDDPGIDYSKDPSLPESGYHDMPVAGHNHFRGGAWDIDTGQLPDGRWAADFSSAAGSPGVGGYQRQYFATREEAEGAAKKFLGIKDTSDSMASPDYDLARDMDQENRYNQRERARTPTPSRTDVRAAELVNYYRENGDWPELAYTYSGDEYVARNQAHRIIHKPDHPEAQMDEQRLRRMGLTAAGYDESKHRRYPKGTPVSGKAGGGRFAPGDRVITQAGSTATVVKELNAIPGAEPQYSLAVDTAKGTMATHAPQSELLPVGDPSDPGNLEFDAEGRAVMREITDESSSPSLPRPAHYPDPKVEKIIEGYEDADGNWIENFTGWSVNANGLGSIDTEKVGWDTQDRGMSQADAQVIAAHADEISAIVESGGSAQQGKRDKLTEDLARGGRADLASFHSMFGPQPGQKPRARITARVTPTGIEIGEYDYGTFKTTIPRKDVPTTTTSGKHDPPMPTRRDVATAMTIENWGKPLPAGEPNATTKRMRRKARGITAAVTIPIAPPTAWFKDPGLGRATPLTVTADGKVFGHLALWDACHIGDPSGPGVCVAPPRSSTGYTLFHLGELETAEGELVPVGKITMGTGHASLQASRGGAVSHYDNTGSVVADVRAGEDRHGIWISGALRPSVTEAQVRELRAAGVSGDWRRYRHALELVAALAVNVPGFPIPRVAALVAPDMDGDERLALVAAGLERPLVPGPMGDTEAIGRIEALALLAGVGGEPVMDLYFPRSTKID